MEEVVERSNLKLAYQRVVENKGAPGVDDVRIPEFKDWLKVHWPSVKIALLEGRYLPRPVRRVDIPKPAGGIRMRGERPALRRPLRALLNQTLAHQLLSNILLNDLDQELERRKLAFCRYADDCNIYVGSRVAGNRVMSGIRTFLEEVLKLRINTEKSAVARPWERKFLGFSVTAHRESRLRIAPASGACNG